MAVRSALQKRKEREQSAEAAISESLRRGTLAAQAKQAASQIVPEAVGRHLYEKYRDYAVRTPESFNRPIKTRSRRAITLAYSMYMFGDYPVAKFLQTAFLDATASNEARTQLRIKDDDLIAVMSFMAVRGGKSVWREVTSDYLTKKETHSFVNCSFEFTVREAFVFALALSDTDRSNAHRIAKSRVTQEYRYGSKFWREVIRFFARHPASKRDISDVVDYLRNKYAENQNYSLKGRSLAMLKRSHEEWVREMGRMKALGTYTWDGLPLKDLRFKTRDGKHAWYLFQIRSSGELGKEGTAMRHCVLSYRPLCSAGSIGIFSLRYRDGRLDEHTPYDKCLTIEISNSGQIRQVRGFANRMPFEFENEAVAYWAAQNGLNYTTRSLW